MKTEKTKKSASIRSEEEQATSAKLIGMMPSTSMFWGWGPRMNGSFSGVLRTRN